MAHVHAFNYPHRRPAAEPNAADYAALRRGGSSAASARAQLRLDEAQAARFEAVFRAQASRGAGGGRLPKFARHERHVAAVMAQGGFPALTERRTGGCAMVTLPLAWPEPTERSAKAKRRG